MPLGPFVRNSCGYGASAVGALLVTRSIYWLRGQGQIDKLLSRKLAHIGNEILKEYPRGFIQQLCSLT